MFIAFISICESFCCHDIEQDVHSIRLRVFFCFDSFQFDDDCVFCPKSPEINWILVSKNKLNILRQCDITNVINDDMNSLVPAVLALKTKW